VRARTGGPWCRPLENTEWVDPRHGLFWLGLMVTSLTIAVLSGGVLAFGAAPFIASFAVLNFSWRFAGVITAITMILVITISSVAGSLEEIWFIPIIIVSVGASTALLRLGIQRSDELNDLHTQLALSEERERISRDVHDVLGHSLTAIVLKTQVADALLAKVESPAPEVGETRGHLAEMQGVSREALTEIRSTVTGFRARGLSEEVSAARFILSDAGVSLQIHGDPATLPEDLKPVLGWVVRESVTNIVRHADASSCEIELGGTDSLLAVSDDGAGRDSSREGNGLSGLRERLANYGLALEISDESGTTLSVVPVGIAA